MSAGAARYRAIGPGGFGILRLHGVKRRRIVVARTNRELYARFLHSKMCGDDRCQFARA